VHRFKPGGALDRVTMRGNVRRSRGGHALPVTDSRTVARVYHYPPVSADSGGA